MGDSDRSKFLWKEIVSLVFSSVALILSGWALWIAHNAHEFSEREYIEERSLVLRGTVPDSDIGSLHITSVDPAQQFIRATMYFPPQLNTIKQRIESPDYRMSLTSVEYVLQQLIQETTEVDPKNYVIGEDAHMFVIMYSEYTTNGVAYEDLSVYDLSYMFQVSGDAYKLPSITFKGLSFQDRLPLLSRDLDKYVESIFNFGDFDNR